VTASDVAKLAALSPFELRNRLVALAQSHAERVMLNASRGNPNFLATAPRYAFFRLGMFAMGEAERSAADLPAVVAGMPQAAGIAARFEAFLAARPERPGIAFLAAVLRYARKRLGFDADGFVHELAQSILGCQYPEPVRMLPFSERIVRRYLQQEIFADRPIAGGIDLFAVEGATAGIAYIFNTLRENGVLAAGDAIAIGTPIFTPYLEIPLLADYRLVELSIAADPAAGWQYPAPELDKLLDPRVKTLLLVNPGNPTSVKIDRGGLERIADIVAQRPDLIILSDDVYGTFADDFVSLFTRCPHNTILVYSFSKYFGATGWRLGVVAVHENNAVDARIAALPEPALRELDARYASLVVEPRRLKFIDRLAADSRAVALNHTAGLSTPQQIQMALFALAALSDRDGDYKRAMKRLIRRRHRALYAGLRVADPPDPNATDYYAILDFAAFGEALYGQDFAEWLLAHKDPIDLLLRLADESGVVLLPGRGFATPHPSARISLANLDAADYTRIGRVIRALLEECAAEYRAAARHA
jgi:aspartate 4-decarboxylase